MKFISTLVFCLCVALPTIAFAGKPDIYSHRKNGAIRGADVVAYYSLEEGEKFVKGDKAHSSTYKGATWYFSSIENKALFDANPEKYAPQYGGYCAFAAAHGFVTASRPNSWKIVDGKLYLNNNKKSFQKWTSDQSEKISKADENWPKILKK